MAAEKNFENKVKKFLKEQGCYFVKYFGCGYTQAGVPDLLVCCQGKFLGVEVKAANGKASELQKHHVKTINEAGGVGIILYPKDFPAFTAMIFAINNGQDWFQIYKKLSFFDCEN